MRVGLGMMAKPDLSQGQGDDGVGGVGDGERGGGSREVSRIMAMGGTPRTTGTIRHTAGPLGIIF